MQFSVHGEQPTVCTNVLGNPKGVRDHIFVQSVHSASTTIPHVQFVGVVISMGKSCCTLKLTAQ
jgi:hypothetical protein